MPVSSLIKIDTPNEGDELSLILQSGAYYYSRNRRDKTYEVVRLLEWRADSCHFQVIGMLDAVPTLEDTKALGPIMSHIPLALEYFLSAHLTYIGTASLTNEDTEGYKVYLEQLEFFNTRAEGVVLDIILKSKKKPLSPVRIKYHNGEVEFS